MRFGFRIIIYSNESTGRQNDLENGLPTFTWAIAGQTPLFDCLNQLRDADWDGRFLGPCCFVTGLALDQPRQSQKMENLLDCIINQFYSFHCCLTFFVPSVNA